MKTLIRILSVLLCLSLLLMTAACEEGPKSSTTPGTTGSTAPIQTTVSTAPVQTTAPTNPLQPDALTLYADAIAILSGRESLRMHVDRADEVSTVSQTVDTVSSQTVSYKGLQTGNLQVVMSEEITYGAYTTNVTEIYLDGNAYATVGGGNFACTMTAEEYTARLLPMVLVDAALYGSVEIDDTAEGTLIRFRDAAELEDWLASDATEFISARADVTLSDDGSLESICYSASYLCANTPVTTTVTALYRECSEEPITAPVNADSFSRVSYLDGLRLLEQAFGYLQSYNTISFDSNITTYISAASLYMYQGRDIDIYDFSSNPQIQINTDFYYMDYYNEASMEQELEERYLNGKYTSSLDGEEPQSIPGITDIQMCEYAMGMMTDYVILPEYLVDATCTDLGSLLLIEFTGSSELGKLFADQLCLEIYGDADLLNDLASAYRTDTMEYYIAVDKYLGLPTAIGVNFQGTHTIDGYEYVSIRQADQSIYLDSLDAYKAINEVAAPGEEPEEKATPVFYHVTGTNGQEMWLLGTIHVGDDRTGYLPKEIYDAFEASDALAVECDSRIFEKEMEADEALQEQVSGLYYYGDGSTARDHIDDQELYDLAVKMMKATGNFFYNAPYLKVASWSSSISNFFIRQGSGLSSDKGVDNRLLELADKTGKEIIEVESSLFQLKMLTGWSDGLSQWQLQDAVHTHGLSYTQSLLELYGLWCSGDEAALIEYMKNDTTGMTDQEMAWWTEYNTAMSTDRNADMAKTAIGYLESGETIFMAVGLAHVLEEDGLVNALRAAGYTVELVEYEG